MILPLILIGSNLLAANTTGDSNRIEVFQPASISAQEEFDQLISNWSRGQLNGSNNPSHRIQNANATSKPWGSDEESDLANKIGNRDDTLNLGGLSVNELRVRGSGLRFRRFIQLTWDASPTLEESISVETSLDGRQFAEVGATTAGDGHYEFPLVSRSFEWEKPLFVRISRENGETSPVVAFRALPDTPEVPRQLKVVVHNAKTTLSWGIPVEPQRGDRLVLEVATLGTHSFREVARVPWEEQNAILDRLGDVAEARIFRAKMSNLGFDSKYCDPVTANFPIHENQAPSDLAVFREKNGVTASWQIPADSNLLGFQLEIAKSSPDHFVLLKTVPPLSRSWFEAKIADDLTESYFFRIRANRENGFSEYSPIARLSPLSYPEEVLFDHPLGYWRLGEHSGNEVHDFSGNGLNGLSSGGVTLSETHEGWGDPDDAMAFDGISGSIVIPDDPRLRFDTTTSYSLEAWIRSYSAVHGAILGKMANSNTYKGYDLFYCGTDLAPADCPGGAIRGFLNWDWAQGGPSFNGVAVFTEVGNGATPTNDGKWHHLVLSRSAEISGGAGFKFYVDGVLQLTTIQHNNLSNPVTTVPFTIGSRSADSYFKGAIDEAAVYGFALAPQRISAHFEARARAACVVSSNRPACPSKPY